MLKVELPGEIKESTVIEDFTNKVYVEISNKTAALMEQRIKVILNSKPKYMPVWIWWMMVKKVISFEYYPLEIKQVKEGE